MKDACDLGETLHVCRLLPATTGILIDFARWQFLNEADAEAFKKWWVTP